MESSPSGKHFSNPAPIRQIPLDNLPAERIADAMALARALRDGYAPRTYIAGTPSAIPLIVICAACMRPFARSS